MELVLIQKSILKLLHEGHLEMTSCKNLARGNIYWPNMNTDIENFITQCEICTTHRRNNTKQTLINHDYKFLPWNKVGVDFFELPNKEYYLIAVDYFSKYPEIQLLKGGKHSSETVITSLKSIFSRHGIPYDLVTDGGPPFTSAIFKDFTNNWNINHIVTSPYHSQSNGLVERTIGTIKHLLTKCLKDKTDPYITLLNYRNTPKFGLCSPAQLCMSRSLRTKIPIADKNLKPTLVNLNKYKQSIHSNQEKHKQYYNKHAKDLKPLRIGDNIFFKKNPQASTWTQGIIKQIGPKPRSDLIESSEGNLT